MSTLVREIDRAKATDQEIDSFEDKAIRSVENMSFEAGDVFTFPTDFTGRIFRKNLGAGTADYILVEVTDGPNKDNTLPFYPSTFVKSRPIYNDNKTPTGKRKYTTGSAAELYRQFNKVTEGMDALKGKTVKFTKMERIQTIAFSGDRLASALIPTIDLVED